MPENGFWYRNHINPDFMFGFQGKTFLYDKKLTADETPKQLIKYDLLFSKAKDSRSYWKLRRAKIAKLKKLRSSKITFEKSIVWKLSLKIFTLAIVNGAYLRKYFDPHFIQGGQTKVYSYIPKGFFIVEKALDKREIPVVFMHEILEYFLMSPKRNYQRSHDIADKLERYVRKILFT